MSLEGRWQRLGCRWGCFPSGICLSIDLSVCVKSRGVLRWHPRPLLFTFVMQKTTILHSCFHIIFNPWTHLLWDRTDWCRIKVEARLLRRPVILDHTYDRRRRMHFMCLMSESRQLTGQMGVGLKGGGLLFICGNHRFISPLKWIRENCNPSWIIGF